MHSRDPPSSPASKPAQKIFSKISETVARENSRRYKKKMQITRDEGGGRSEIKCHCLLV